ncbi:MAG: GDSL-type esterase/lipase family protein [Acidobacteriota bacterium]|nr:GDSL-type esterase/lipase family protein [Acidobacteriota bacterium]MDH3786655.1 GDSL-type esterase/lipase family protein [Acidobacteriota bacterium]
MTASPDRLLPVHRAVYLSSFSLSLALVALVLPSDVRWGWLLLPLLGVSVVGTVWMGRRHRRGRSVGPFLMLAMLNLMLVVPELALRVGGFRYESGIQFGYPRPTDMVRLLPDKRLFWRLPSTRSDVNSLGFPGDEPRIPKPEGAFRIVFLGDSCTYQGYPTFVGGLLNERRLGDLEIDIVNLSVSGYSSHQGRILADTLVPRLEPDLVFVYYGWNDHWRAYGDIDADKVVDVPRGLRATRGYRKLSNLRLAQFIRWLGATLRSRPDASAGRVRVPADHYRANLTAIANAMAELGTPTVFVTAPTTHYRLGVPQPLIDRGFGSDADSIVDLHRRYNDIVRTVTDREGVALFDLERRVIDSPELDRHFLRDGIHFSDPGMQAMAVLFADRIEELVSVGARLAEPE